MVKSRIRFRLFSITSIVAGFQYYRSSIKYDYLVYMCVFTYYATGAGAVFMEYWGNGVVKYY